MSRNMQGTISDRNDTLLMQKRTFCEQECAGMISDLNDIDAGTHFL